MSTQIFEALARQNFMIFIRWLSSQSYSKFQVKDSCRCGASSIGSVRSVACGCQLLSVGRLIWNVRGIIYCHVSITSNICTFSWSGLAVWGRNAVVQEECLIFPLRAPTRVVATRKNRTELHPRQDCAMYIAQLPSWSTWQYFTSLGWMSR
jgi:hypothetical protein